MFNVMRKNRAADPGTGDRTYQADNEHQRPSTGHLLVELNRIRHVLDVLPLPDDTTAVANRELGEAEIALLDAEPDRQRTADALQRLALALAGSGALDHAGQALSGPLDTLADWLGDAGLPIRQLLA